MKTVGQPPVPRSLIAWLHPLRRDSGRRWGTLTPHEMLCEDWQRWAFKHTDHHLRQFDV